MASRHSRRIVWTQEAIQDLHRLREQVYLWKGRSAVEALKTNLQSKLALFQKFPQVGMESEKRKGIRKFRLNDHYNIFYEPRRELLVIHGIIPSWLRDWE